MRVTIKKWGNSASLRIPKLIMKSANLNLDDVVEVREENGEVIIKAIKPNEYNLSELLSGITSTNQHGEVDFGPAVGKETF